MKKMPGDIILSHMHPKNYDQMMHGSWDMVHDRWKKWHTEVGATPKNKKKLVEKQTKIISNQQTWLFRKLYLRKKYFFQEKIKKNANNSKELWNAFKSLGMKSVKVSQSKNDLKNSNLQKMQIFLRISTLI